MEYDANEFRAMTDEILVSVFSGCKIAAEHMKKNHSGVILNASSYSAIIPNAGRGPYSACKAGVSSLTRSFAAELAADHIRVLAYVPGMIATEISRNNIEKNGERLMKSIPMKRFGMPEDLSKVIVFLASDCASYINGVHSKRYPSRYGNQVLPVSDAQSGLLFLLNKYIPVGWSISAHTRFL